MASPCHAPLILECFRYLYEVIQLPFHPCKSLHEYFDTQLSCLAVSSHSQAPHFPTGRWPRNKCMHNQNGYLIHFLYVIHGRETSSKANLFTVLQYNVHEILFVNIICSTAYVLSSADCNFLFLRIFIISLIFEDVLECFFLLYFTPFYFMRSFSQNFSVKFSISSLSTFFFILN